jgi:hypothetical protein
MGSTTMLREETKKRIRIYSPREHDRVKALRRQADAAEVAEGNVARVQDRNRALPHGSQMVLPDLERELPSE